MADVATTAASEQASAPPAVFKKRANKANFRKRPATPPPAADSDSDSGSQYSSEDESGQRVKRRRRNGVAVSLTKKHEQDLDGLHATKHAADKSATIDVINDATRQSNWYDEPGSNSKASRDRLSERNLLGSSRARTELENTTSDASYKGSANYQSFIQKNPNAPSKQFGPVKAPTNIRTITVTDFAPDVCKDYKQTGFCGFGDSCKFLHAREDYKQGWELDKEWEIGTKGRKVEGRTVASATRGVNGDADEDAEDAMLENIPFACVICKEPYKSPIVTKCSHYFCERCALDRYRKNPSCAVCGAGTGGVFNTAKNLKKLLEKKSARARDRREKAIEAGEPVSDEEESES